MGKNGAGAARPSNKEQVVLALAGREVAISNPAKLYFPAAGITKLQLVEYYLSVAEGALRGIARRPLILKRYVNGIGAEPFYQKRVAHQPEWIETAVFRFPSGRVAEEVVVNDVAALAWIVNLGCIDLHPHPIRKEDMDRPDELRIDLDPVPGVPWSQIAEVARVVKQVLDDHGLVGWPKTSGSRGAHIWVRIAPKWPFTEVRRAAQAFAREVERRAPAIATAKWWKEQRHGVFLDFNQNARDRTTASAYSVRPNPEARVSMPLSWADFFACDPNDFTLKTVPAIFKANGDAHAGIDAAVCSLEPLLKLADAQAPVDKGAPDLPVITIGQAKQKADAMAGLERWKAKHPAVFAKLGAEDLLVDTNRGRASAWYRIRVNLKNVPPEERPAEAPPDPDYDPKTEWTG